MREPEDVLEHLRVRFERDYPTWARGKGTWPIRVSLMPPSTKQRSADPVGCHTWAARWAAYPGPGRVEHTRLRFPTGIHDMPKALVIDRPTEAAAVGRHTREIWMRCGRRLPWLQHRFPEARFTGIVRKLIELDEQEYRLLADAVTWLRDNPTSGLLLRQLPIEGIDTKWLGRHSGLVLALLGEPVHPSAAQTQPGPSGSARRRLHERLGLRVPPELIQVAVPDPEMRAQLGGMRHFAASVEDLSRWPHIPHTVIILENKETGYALTDDHTGTIVLHGQGFNVTDYARITWIRTARAVFYWGDIDAPGLQFVNDLRNHGILARTILMDVPTLERFRHLAVDGSGPQRETLPHLTDSEQMLYEHLVKYAAEHGTGLLLEQERIPWPHAHTILTAAIRQGEEAAFR
jgi:hypothetical protein